MAKKRVTKTATVSAERAVQAVKFAEQLTMDDIIRQMGDFASHTQTSLAAFTSAMQNKLADSLKLDDAIKAKSDMLVELTAKEAAAIELDELLLEIETTKETWAREKARNAEQQTDEEREYKESVTRLKASDEHARTLRMRMWQDDFDANVVKAQQVEKNRQAALEYGWQLREEALKEQEVEVAELRKRVDNFETTKTEAVRSATEALRAQLIKDHKSEMALFEARKSAADQLASTQLAQQETSMRQLVTQNDQLRAQVAMAEDRTLQVITSALGAQSEAKRADSIMATAEAAASGRSKK